MKNDGAEEVGGGLEGGDRSGGSGLRRVFEGLLGSRKVGFFGFGLIRKCLYLIK